MPKRIRAVYRDGAFHTDEPLDLPEGASVWLDITPLTPEELLEDATRIYEGLTEEEITEIERAMLEPRQLMREFFDRLSAERGEEKR